MFVWFWEICSLIKVIRWRSYLYSCRAFSFSIYNIKLGCTYDSILTAARLFFKSLASVSCLYFLTFNTPVFEVLSVLRKLKVPKLFVELMGLIYRFIFLLLDTANMIYISQNSRLGYSTLKTSFSSLGKLITTLFISSYKRSQDIYNAMESRCYDGDINLLENNYTYSYKNITLIIVVIVDLRRSRSLLLLLLLLIPLSFIFLCFFLFFLDLI